jgi:predicted amidohydrolase YtcJ
LISDMDTADKYWGTRTQYAYPFQSLLQNGTNIVFGSDSPVESPNPFLGIFAATCRCKENGFPDTLEWYPEQKISLFEAIRAYTTSPAKLAGWKKYSGRIFPNEFADLIVLDEDIFQLPNDQIKNLLPSATMVSGEWMWQK